MKIIPVGYQSHYNEIPQSNPLRWVILHREMADLFTAQSSEFKCKDFFNEFVAKYSGHDTSIYGFNAGAMKVNDDFLYVQLLHIADLEVYKKNIGSINALAAKNDMPPVELIIEDAIVVAVIPRAYFKSTWLISLLTYLMRVANVKAVVEDPEWKTHPSKGADNPFSNYYDRILARGFAVPDIATSFYFVGNSIDYKAKPQVHFVHNNGCRNWMEMLQVEGKL